MRNDVIHCLRRGSGTLTCETRLNPDGPGYQLVITENSRTHIEDFATLPQILAREHELLAVWRAQGWRDARAPRPTAAEPWSGRR